MQRLRQATFLARLVLAWFALAIGAAVAAPVVQPRSIELLCTGTGAMKLLVQGAEGQPAPAGHTLDCPLCGAATAPPPVVLAVAPDAPRAQQLRRHPAGRMALRSGAPLPARGPPPSAIS